MGKRFLHNRAAVVTVAFVLLIALIGILAPLLAPHDPYVTDILNKFAPYSMEYPLGTDHLGRCVLSRLIYGIRPTLGLALLTMLGTIALVVRRNGDADARRAHDDTVLALSARDGTRGGLAENGIVAALGGVSAAVLDLVAQALQLLFDVFLHGVSAVVTAQCDLHSVSPFVSQIL